MIAELLPLAAVVALSPIPIVAVIVMLMTDRARANGAAYAAGWTASLAVIGGVVLVLAGAPEYLPDGDADDTADVLWILIGTGLLLLATRKWLGRPAAGSDPEMPKWLASVDEFTALKSLAFGFVLAAINPKSLAMAIAAGLAIAENDLPSSEAAASLGLFVLLGSSTVVLPVLMYVVAGDRVDPTLARWKRWLTRHNAAVVAITLAVIGTVLLVQGVAGLAF